MSICTDCVHWIGEPVSHCELGPNQYPSCLMALLESQEAVREPLAEPQGGGCDGNCALCTTKCQSCLDYYCP